MFFFDIIGPVAARSCGLFSKPFAAWLTDTVNDTIRRCHVENYEQDYKSSELYLHAVQTICIRERLTTSRTSCDSLIPFLPLDGLLNAEADGEGKREEMVDMRGRGEAAKADEEWAGSDGSCVANMAENIDTHESGRQNNNGSNAFDAPLTIDPHTAFADHLHNANGGNGKYDVATPTARGLPSPRLSPTRISCLSSRRWSNRWTRPPRRTRLQQSDLRPHPPPHLLRRHQEPAPHHLYLHLLHVGCCVAPSNNSAYDNSELEFSDDGADDFTDSTAAVRGETRFRLGRLGRRRGCEFAECSNCGAMHTLLWRGLDDELDYDGSGLYSQAPSCQNIAPEHGCWMRRPQAVRADAVGVVAQCYNCYTTATPLWRRERGEDRMQCMQIVLQASWLRAPISTKSDVIRKRSHHDPRRSGATSSISPVSAVAVPGGPTSCSAVRPRPPLRSPALPHLAYDSASELSSSLGLRDAPLREC
ncbi:hypothetical protein B0H13DRAFT_2519065 [Mycena leptocephala]|nr:hypothetical protein B0H13DRAFT_2519065 [Mycena leptocephala]